MDKQSEWTTIIEPKGTWYDLKLKEVWQARELILLFVRRNLATMYKQTILGPLWLILNPLLTTTMFTLIFGRIANLSTEGIPQFLFYLGGNTIWSYFSTCLTKNSTTFVENAKIFGKVYFPRLVVPIANVITNMVSLAVQFLMFLIAIAVVQGTQGIGNISIYVWMIPFLILQIAILGMGVGIILSSITAKYRDLSVMVTLGIQFWMYVTPVVYPASQIPKSLYKLLMLNPMSPIVETFRYVFLGVGKIPWVYLLISIIETVLLLIVGLLVFHKVERNFVDTV